MKTRKVKLNAVSLEERERLWRVHLSTIGPHISRDPLGGRSPTLYDEGGRKMYWNEKELRYTSRREMSYNP